MRFIVVMVPVGMTMMVMMVVTGTAPLRSRTLATSTASPSTAMGMASLKLIGTGQMNRVIASYPMSSEIRARMIALEKPRKVAELARAK